MSMTIGRDGFVQTHERTTRAMAGVERKIAELENELETIRVAMEAEFAARSWWARKFGPPRQWPARGSEVIVALRERRARHRHLDDLATLLSSAMALPAASVTIGPEVAYWVCVYDVYAGDA